MNSVEQAARQQQFLKVISREEATERFQAALRLSPLGRETVSLDDCHGRVLAGDVASPIDVPGFDRSNVDGFAVRAEDTRGAMEESPRSLRLNEESLLPGVAPQLFVASGTATPISTGGMLPRGTDAVLMIEDSDFVESGGDRHLEVRKSVSAGQFISFAGSDIAKGETVLWAGTKLSSREISVLAAIGQTEVSVYRRPRVAILSTGDEVVSPGEPLPPGCVYDSNAAILSAAVRECGGSPTVLGRVKDNLDELSAKVQEALSYDVILLSGGTSKGAGDLSYRVVQQFTDPGIVAHGVALKPGKPICLAVTQGKPVVILPGFPTSAIFTYHEFVAPVIRAIAGMPLERRESIPAKVPQRIHSDKGRTEYSLVRLFETPNGVTAFPLGKGSGSVTTFSQADGFITIPQTTEILDAGTTIDVTLLDRQLTPVDLVVMGSHCIGLDSLLAELRRRGRSVSTMHIGSQGGLNAVKRGECHLAGIHLLDPETDQYNAPFLDESLHLIRGYQRMQSFVFRPDDERFAEITAAKAALQRALSTPDCVMVNRNPGSGTRLLTDQLFKELGNSGQPDGYANQVKSHNAVAAALAQGRADWGIAIETVARSYGLATLPLRAEHYDFVVREEQCDHPLIREFQCLLQEPSIREHLAAMGFSGVGEGD
ncbi:MAG: molybdopterin biosynthesis protein [Planctomycetaceae bacterium]|nr:molybdopterin biosynthesis protein [Planctomycetaceae bacterium]